MQVKAYDHVEGRRQRYGARAWTEQRVREIKSYFLRMTDATRKGDLPPKALEDALHLVACQLDQIVKAIHKHTQDNA